ncbi:MAG: AbrB/MazE/SpoVT family DNA-binding domain-containing protein [Alphaproteobacteria bacterium]|jgi:antitoxin component of MazEF toxin-antitoxin module|nr:AbrB/MazE/SpoVT family DNA-binding domain-containing protein [Alphaproteobacteria bacterium]
MRSQVGLWGGSCAVRLPEIAVETLGLHDGATIDIQIENRALVIRPGRPVYRLADLVAQAKNLTPPTPLDDAPMGREEL